jgi:DNA-binding NarL/FixJ family response regulator
VLLLARQALARAGLRGLLAESADAVVVGQAASAEDVERLASGLAPDLLLAAWDSGDADELTALADAQAVAHVPVVLVGEAARAPSLVSLVRAGVQGYVASDAPADQVGMALRAARAGLLVFDPLLARIVAASVPQLDLSGDEPLTERELQVLQLLAAGLANKIIATRLGISEHTVKFHVGSIMAKLDAASRTEAVTRAARRGLLAL